MENLNSCIQLNLKTDQAINHVTFDGNNYFCTIENKDEIIKLTTNFSIVEIYSTIKQYDCICYDPDDKCFWVSSKFCNDKIFKLNLDMKEINYICIKENKSNNPITGISYNCNDSSLIVSFNCKIIDINKKNKSTKLLYIEKYGFIVGVLSLSPGLIITVYKNKKYYFVILLPHKKVLKCYSMNNDNNIKIKDLILNCFNNKSSKFKFEIFTVQKQNKSYVCCWNLNAKNLGFKANCCNFKICNCSHNLKSNVCNDIIESIALVETSIAHILNAEGEKLQKVLAETDDIETILLVNEKVSKTIVSVTHLEHVLYDKLNKILESGLCCSKCPNENTKSN